MWGKRLHLYRIYYICIGRLRNRRGTVIGFFCHRVRMRDACCWYFKSENSRFATAVQNFTRSEPDFWGRRDRCAGRTVTTTTTRFNYKINNRYIYTLYIAITYYCIVSSGDDYDCKSSWKSFFTHPRNHLCCAPCVIDDAELRAQYNIIIVTCCRTI